MMLFDPIAVRKNRESVRIQATNIEVSWKLPRESGHMVDWMKCGLLHGAAQCSPRTTLQQNSDERPSRNKVNQSKHDTCQKKYDIFV
jgi:hypothetical protein